MMKSFNQNCTNFGFGNNKSDVEAYVKKHGIALGDEYERKVGSQTDGQLIEMIERSIAEFVKVRGENPDSETLTSEEEQRIIQEQLKNLGYL